MITPRGVQFYDAEQSFRRRTTINRITEILEYCGYSFIEVPLLTFSDNYTSMLEGTENKLLKVGDNLALIPEATKYIKDLNKELFLPNMVYYVTKCFRDEATTDSERFREFTQIGVEYLGDNPLDCRKKIRKDAIYMFSRLLGQRGWKLENKVERGLNLYIESTGLEIYGETNRKQVLGGGAYEGGAGWAIGLERFMKLDELLKQNAIPG